MSMHIGYSWVEEHYCCKPGLCPVSPGTWGRGAAPVMWWVLSFVFCSLERSHPSPVCTQWTWGVPSVEIRGNGWHWDGTAGPAVLVWPIQGLQDLAGGSSAGDFRLCCAAPGGNSSTALQKDYFSFDFTFFLPVKDSCKHWAFKLKGVNESVPVATIIRSLVHSTVALRWFPIISKSIPEVCSRCYSPPVHHCRCRFAAQHGR